LLGANTIGLYNCGLFNWGTIQNVSSGQTFCRTIYPIAAQNNVGVIVGYFSNASVNWNDSTVRNTLTTQFKKLVGETKGLSTTKGYLIGNEIFENLPTESEKVNYAKWIGSLVNWATKQTKIPVFYADSSELVALPYLKQYAPRLSVYAINTYKWQNASELTTIVDTIVNKWGNTKVLLHEWGVDSFDSNFYIEDRVQQAARIKYLALEIEKVSLLRPQTFWGALMFSYEDDYSKMGSPSVQDKDLGAAWTCTTCFDFRANEEFWGIKNKPAYYSLQEAWSAFAK
jgi:hypothetical protein